MFLIEISLLLFLISGTELNGKERGTLGGQGDQRGLYKYISSIQRRQFTMPRDTEIKSNK